MNPNGDIVVGYDGSPTSQRAIQFAAAEAAEHAVRVADRRRVAPLADHPRAISSGRMPIDTEDARNSPPSTSPRRRRSRTRRRRICRS